ncbi:uncharacterized protein LOC103361544 [Stegastes partitus]|uniref:Uncharacterized protein LOC103361544 n=1 Tax=Stegastes partitus TaxID=144197 RepID=A0A9Y4N709_9TELE|nr:PREDICTED: uncharacterized protein LOC103361544 [Stegastes partitus]
MWFCAALWGETGGITIVQQHEGESFSFTWYFGSNASVKFFCRRECEGGDVLVRTAQNDAVSSRYAIEYKPSPPAGGYVTVLITTLNASDSGRYRLGVGGSLLPDEFGDFEIRVTNGSDGNLHERFNIHTGEEGGDVSVHCWFDSLNGSRFFCRNDCSDGDLLLWTTGHEAQSGRYSISSQEQPLMEACTVVLHISRLSLSDTGLYSCGLGEALNPTSLSRFHISVVPSASTAPTATRSSGSEGFPPSSACPETCDRFSGLPPLVGCVLLMAGLSVLVLVLLYKLKKKNQDVRNKQFVVYENTREGSIYQSLDPGATGLDEPYSTIKQDAA